MRRNWKHDRATVLEGVNYVAEGRHDGAVQQKSESIPRPGSG